MQVARQIAEILARLDRGPRQDDAGDAAVLQRLDGGGDGEVSLAGARRPHREGQAMGADRLDQPLLPRPLGPDLADVALLAPLLG